MFDGGNAQTQSLPTRSPFSSRINGGDPHYNTRILLSSTQPCMTRSVGIHSCLKSLSQLLLRITPGELLYEEYGNIV